MTAQQQIMADEQLALMLQDEMFLRQLEVSSSRSSSSSSSSSSSTSSSSNDSSLTCLNVVIVVLVGHARV